MQGLRLGEAAMRARHRPALLLALTLTLLFLGLGVAFAWSQNVWIEETTQLAGAALPFDRAVAWLAGMPEPDIAMLPDWMPPFSYLIDHACALWPCGTPIDFRMLHLLISLAGVGLILWLAARAGVLATMVAGALLVLSPKLIETAVEIRPYPILFTLTAVQIALIDRLIRAERIDGRWIVALGSAGVAAIYTHFYGAISTLALMLGLGMARVRGERDALWIGGCALALMAAAAGLYPFLGGAAGGGVPGGGATPGAGEMAKYLLRQLGSPANMVVLPAGILFFAALGGLAAVALGRLGVALSRDPAQARGRLAVALAVALIAGLAATMLVALLFPGFDALRPAYSIWTLPVLALLAADACRGLGWREPWDRRVRRALPFLAGALVLAAAVGQGLFLRHPRWFVHGPSTAIAAELQAFAGVTGIVYDDVDWPFGFFPIYYSYSEGVPQWLLGKDGQLHRLTRGGVVVAQPEPADAIAEIDRLFLIGIRSQPNAALRPLLIGRRDAQAEADATPPPVSFPGFHLAGTRAEPGLYWTRIDRFDKNPL